MLFHSSKKPTELSIVNLNKKQRAINERFGEALGGKGYKKMCQSWCSFGKKDKKDPEKTSDNKLYVIDFYGDIKASAADRLREEVSAIISSAKLGDEVVVRLESAGGQVHSYGMAAAQLERIKNAGLVLTVCVDKVAASGGYMMACIADKVIAAPFAIVGSIGVVSQMPNFHDFLKKHDINVELFTAGEYKRTVTMFGENSEEDRAKYQSELERIHQLFKNHVAKYRPNLDIEKVATGEFWFGSDAKDLALVDELGVSDSYLLEKMKTHTVLYVHSHQKPTIIEKLGLAQSGQMLANTADFFKNNVMGLNKLTSRLPL